VESRTIVLYFQAVAQSGKLTQKIAFEIAMLGSRGLDVSDSAERYTLQSISGNFSGLHLLCFQYVGFQIIDPKVDLGFDLLAEYQTALSVHEKGNA
jgi:hypothetical protein